MNNEKIKKWHQEHPQGKAPLSWDLNDYEAFGDEPPQSLQKGKTEGEAMDQDDILNWAEEMVRNLSVMREEFPEKFEEQYKNYLLDLEYLCSLDKITSDELKNLAKRENFNFGQE